MVGPSHTTTPPRTGSPLPGISRSASIRSIHRLLLAALAQRAARVDAGLPHLRREPPDGKYRGTRPACPAPLMAPAGRPCRAAEAAHGYADTIPLEGFRGIHHSGERTQPHPPGAAGRGNPG